MKLTEIVTLSSNVNQLDEVNFKQAVAAGALSLGALMSPSSTLQTRAPAQEPTTQRARADIDIQILATTILQKYKISPKLATKVATLAKKYEHSSFPKATDILAIAGIESSFIPHSVSSLKKDPAVGLMQVRPKIWGLDHNTLVGDMDLQIKSGADVLRKYYKLLGNKEDAVHAYNVGLGNFRRGKHNLKYVHKYKAELQLYKT